MLRGAHHMRQMLVKVLINHFRVQVSESDILFGKAAMRSVQLLIDPLLELLQICTELCMPHQVV